MNDIHELASEINRKRRLSIAKAVFDDIEKLPWDTVKPMNSRFIKSR